MNEDGNMNITADTANKASELRPDIDLNDPKLGLKIAAERLSIVRYVFLVQIEDGIASAAQRASLEYADAVLIGWPETDSPEVADLDDAQLKIVREHMELMEGYIGKYSQMEHDGDLDGMTDTLIRITERVAEVRRLYQPDFPLPTFAEIRRVVQDEWDEDMGKIDPREDNPTAGEIEEETESADDAAGEGDHKMSGVTDSHKTAASVQSENQWNPPSPPKSLPSPKAKPNGACLTCPRRPGPAAMAKAGFPHAATGIRACASASWAARSTRFTTATWSPPPK